MKIIKTQKRSPYLFHHIHPFIEYTQRFTLYHIPIHITFYLQPFPPQKQKFLRKHHLHNMKFYPSYIFGFRLYVYCKRVLFNPHFISVLKIIFFSTHKHLYLATNSFFFVYNFSVCSSYTIERYYTPVDDYFFFFLVQRRTTWNMYNVDMA